MKKIIILLCFIVLSCSKEAEIPWAESNISENTILENKITQIIDQQSNHKIYESDFFEVSFSEVLKDTDFDSSKIISNLRYLESNRPTCNGFKYKWSCPYKDDLYYNEVAWDTNWNTWITAIKWDEIYYFYNEELIYQNNKYWDIRFYQKWKNSYLEITYNEYSREKIQVITFENWENLNEKYNFTSLKNIFFYKNKMWFIADENKIYFDNKLLNINVENINNKSCCMNPSLFQITENWFLQFAEKKDSKYLLHEINLNNLDNNLIKTQNNINTDKWNNLNWSKSSCVEENQVKIYTYMYHFIRNLNWDNPHVWFINNAVITENFVAQMKKFQELETQEKIKIIFLSDLENYLKNDCFPHKNLVIFTADDWWDDNFINLYPIAKKHNIKFHLSIISGFTKDARKANFMTKSEVKKVSDDENFEIIWHTQNHLDLRFLDKKTATQEICQSKKDLEKFNEKKVNTLIYPAGKYNQDTINLAKSCDYTFWFTTQWGISMVDDIKNTPFELPRIRVSRDTKISTLISYFD